ncbi:zinc metalloproteinase nas-8 [Caerostris darwini]|uniref:Metalloendopeptidase n=1 Tax=Caerostris darwini TaxID=1538125 RepID=A0AAV4WG84_9ARAC|nr:zinc metalloproteinase nas-8 [Caerostris darwini]
MTNQSVSRTCSPLIHLNNVLELIADRGSRSTATMEGFYAIALLAALVCCHNTFASNPMENEELFEGDIAGIDPYAFTDRNAVVDEAEIWPNGTVFYEIGYKLRKVKDIIQEAFEEFENKTCVRFVPKTVSTKDYLKFTIAGGCWSSVGRKGGEQEISLAEGCHDKVSAVHEIGHALGLWHEHSRSDRDDYLEIIWSNIKPGAERNFFKLLPWQNNLLGEEFDYKSIMLYGEYAFAKDRNSMTMKPKKEGVVIGLINDKPGLSESDVRRLNKLYECDGNPRPPPPDVPDYKCNFEKDLCGMENHENNYKTNWILNNGTLGGRTGAYIAVNAEDASFRKIRIMTPILYSYGRKKGCLKFDVFFNGGGVVSLDISVHTIHTSRIIMKHIDKAEDWQEVKVPVNLEGDVKFSLDARTRKSDGEGVIALSNLVYQLRECE